MGVNVNDYPDGSGLKAKIGEVGLALGTGANAVASGNIGCITQIRTHLRDLGRDLPVMHTLEVLERSYAGGGLSNGR